MPEEKQEKSLVELLRGLGQEPPKDYISTHLVLYSLKCIKEGNIEKAIEHLQELNRIGPVKRYRTIAFYFFLFEEDYASAEANFREVVKLEPDASYILHFLGISLSKQGKFSEAEPYFEKSVELFPENAFYRDWLAGNYFHLGKFTKAKAEYRKELEHLRSSGRFRIQGEDYEKRIQEQIAKIEQIEGGE